MSSISVEGKKYSITGVIYPVVFATLAFFTGLGRGALMDWDEAIYADISKEIVQNHRWLTPYFNHTQWFEKPPLSFWIRAALFKIFGINEFWARVPSALAGVATVFVLYLIVRRLFGAPAATYASLVLIATQFIQYARFGTTDALLTFCIYLAIYGYIRVRDGSSYWWLVTGIAVGCGAMIKGPAVLVAPFAIGVDAIWDKQLAKFLRSPQLWLAIGIAAAIVVPWHIWMFVHYGRPFFETYLGYHIFARAFTPLEGNVGGPFFYFRPLLKTPWIFVVGLGFASGVGHARQRSCRILWLLPVIVLVLYTLVRTKLLWYVMPVYPALAALAGSYIALAISKRPALRPLFVAAVVVLVSLMMYRMTRMQETNISNNEARLALRAQLWDRPSPLMVIETDNLDIPTIVFYSNRKVDGRDLAEFQSGDVLSAMRGTDVILEKTSFEKVAELRRVRLLAEDGPLLYGVIEDLPADDGSSSTR